jgi:hypothetical protein
MADHARHIRLEPTAGRHFDDFPWGGAHLARLYHLCYGAHYAALSSAPHPIKAIDSSTGRVGLRQASHDEKNIRRSCRSGRSPFDLPLEAGIEVKYMLLTYLDEKAWLSLSEAEQQQMMAECTPHMEQLIAKGKFLGGAPLHPTSTAATVRLRDGDRLVTDGPFAETREQLGGYTLIDATDTDEAIRIAAGFLGTRSPAIIEIRPVAEPTLVPHVKRESKSETA